MIEIDSEKGKIQIKFNNGRINIFAPIGLTGKELKKALDKEKDYIENERLLSLAQ